MRYVRAVAVATIALALGGDGFGPRAAHADRTDQLITRLFNGNGPDLDRQSRFLAGPDQPVTVQQIAGPEVFFVPTTGTFLETTGFKTSTIEQLSSFNSWFSDRVKESIYPRGSSTNGSFTYYLGDDDEYVPTTGTLGSVIAERAQTIGAAKLNLGFNYTHERFRKIEGNQLNNFYFTFTHDNPVPNTATSEVINTLVNIDLRRDVLNFNLTWGLTNDWDVGLSVPLVQSTMRVGSTSAIDFSSNLQGGSRKNSPETFAFCNESFVNDLTRNRNGVEVYDGSGFDPTGDRIVDENGQILTENGSPLRLVPLQATPGPINPVDHPFNDFRAPSCDQGEDRSLSSADSESWGIGDLILRTKFHAIKESQWLPDLAFATQTKFNSGDEREFHGNGHVEFLTQLIASKEIAMFTPHINFGVELGTGPSQLDNVQYIVGSDVRLHERLSLAVDVLGRHQIDQDGFGDDIVDISFGGKINPPYVGDLVITGNAIWPLNDDKGLRSEVLYTFGLEFLL